MNEMLNIALGGLLNASDRAVRAADRIARVGAGAQTDFGAALDNSGPRGATAVEDGAALPAGPRTPRPNGGPIASMRYIPSLIEETVQLRIAAQAYKANAALLRAADEVLDITVNSLKKDD